MKKTMLLILVLALALVAEVAKADFTFGDVEPLPEPINTPGIISGDFTMTADGLEAYFVSMNRPGGYGREDIWVCRRQSTEDDWGPVVNLGPKVNTSACDSQPCISADGMELYFGDVSPWGTPPRSGGHGGGDIWVTRRANRDDEWAIPVNLGPTVNSSSMETYPNLSADGLSLYFSDGDIWLATRPTRDDNWGSPVRVTGGVNSGSWEGFPNISADQRVLLFYSDRPGGYGGMDIYMAMRPTVSDAWGPAVNLGPMINTPYYDMPRASQLTVALSTSPTTIRMDGVVIIRSAGQQSVRLLTSTVTALLTLPTCVSWWTTGAKTIPCVTLVRCPGAMASSMSKT